MNNKKGSHTRLDFKIENGEIVGHSVDETPWAKEGSIPWNKEWARSGFLDGLATNLAVIGAMCGLFYSIVMLLFALAVILL